MGEQSLSYRVVRSNRRTIAIQITPGGEVVVRCPRRMHADAIRAFVQSKSGWLEKHMAKRSALPLQPAFTNEQIQELARQALEVVPRRVAYYAPQVGVTYGRITIRNQRSRWGSCSGKGNLNFNCLLMLAPPEVLDYVVVHELCHRREMNHSPKFWAEVARVMPDYQQRKQWLKDNGPALISRMRG